MIYNDFPILNDEQYKIMQDKFNEHSSFNRKEIVYAIYNKLIICNTSCVFLSEKVNKHIRESLNNCKCEFEKTISNLEATFNLKNNKNELKELNFFKFLKILVEITKNLTFWHEKEEKEYFKKFSLNISISLINLILDLTSALEKSNITMYKFM